MNVLDSLQLEEMNKDSLTIVFSNDAYVLNIFKDGFEEKYKEILLVPNQKLWQWQ